MGLHVDPQACSPEQLEAAAEWLRRDGIVAFPTDTFYGFAVNPSSARAVAALFDLKGRDERAALPLVAASLAQIETWAVVTPASARLARAWWPGPLAIVCDAPASVVPGVHAGHGTVAVRVPDHAVARALAAAFGSPVTATSANRSGEPPARSAAELSASIDGRVLVVDGGPTPGGVPSTIVDARGSRPICVRTGAIAWDRVVHSLQP